MHNKEVEINYRDNGLGVSQDDLASLFDPFFTTKSGKGGTGLGTHIIHNLVTDTLNGTISVDSKENEGLHYLITFKDMR